MNYPVKALFFRESDYERALKLYKSFPDRFEILNAGPIDGDARYRYVVEFLDHQFQD